jgi:hypothetical protein
MDFAIASASATNPSPPPPSLVYATHDVHYQFPDFAYRPGFRAGFSYSDNPKKWNVDAEYTFLHQTTSTSLRNPPTDSRGPGVWSLSNWFGTFYPYTTSGIQTKWRSEINLLDLTASYTSQSESYLTFTPFGGVRGVFLYQNFRLHANLANALENPVISKNRSSSWGVGPRAGVQTKWFFGPGLRVEGGLDGSLIFTQYTVKHVDNSDISFASPDLTTGGTSFSYRNYNTVRFMADMSVGLGWERDFNDCLHLDLLASYEFLLMPEQNMMRQITNAYAGADGSVPAGDLTLSGLTFKALFAF